MNMQPPVPKTSQAINKQQTPIRPLIIGASLHGNEWRMDACHRPPMLKISRIDGAAVGDKQRYR
jgi:hypothetical protein